MPTDILDFIHDLRFADIPETARKRAEMCVLDLVGVGIGGAAMPLGGIIATHATRFFGSSTNPVRLAFDGRCASSVGATLAAGMTIDALDAHDGYNPAKGHVGCGLFAAVLALAQETAMEDGQEFLTNIVIGYELGSRLAVALHGTTTDYHTSGAWIAVACAAVGARMLGLDRATTRHALGIGEYHGPRSQMMRNIDFPTMLKDGSGWGAMAGVSAAFLAADGFTGAPAITLESAAAAPYWADLGERWLILEQYFKPYPVCRWAQAPIEAVLGLKRQYALTSDMVEHIEISTFHQSVRLATRDPKNTEQAQYSTSYPCAVALVKGFVGQAEVSPGAFDDPEVRRLSMGLVMLEDETCNHSFPEQRYARAALHLKDGRVVSSGLTSPRWSHENPPTEAGLRGKFHALTRPLIGTARANAIVAATGALADGGSVLSFADLVCQPNATPTCAENPERDMFRGSLNT